MSHNNDTIGKTLTVALLLCIVCSVVVSGSAVGLKKQQQANKALDLRKNIVLAAGLVTPDDVSKEAVNRAFERIETRVVNLDTGEYSDTDPASFDQRKAAKDPERSEMLGGGEDIAGIKRLEKEAKVYLVRQGDQLDKIILPVRGYGLWSTLYGFLALEKDANTVVGLGFYEHAETPGLGGEVDNPRWKALWPGKELFDEQGEVAIEVIKGNAPAGAEHKVDGLSGATLTSKGVSNLVQFWASEDGFGPFLNKLREQGV